MSASKPAFHKASYSYESAAALQRHLVQQLAGAVACTQPQRVLDAGCGTGFLGEWVQSQRKPWQVLGLDVAFGMCAQARRYGPTVQADMSRTPLADASVDGVLCASSLQWVENWNDAFSEWFRILTPGGWLAVSVFVEGTLSELECAFAQIDGYSHLLHFKPAKALQSAAQHAGFSIKHCHHQLHTEPLCDVKKLLWQLKHLGATGKSGAIRRGLMTPAQLRKLEESYPTSPANGTKSVSWSVATLIASKP